MAQAAGHQSLSSRGLGFDPGQSQMIFVTDEDTPERLSLRALCFPPFSIIPPLLHTDLHLLLILPAEQTGRAAASSGQESTFACSRPQKVNIATTLSLLYINMCPFISRIIWRHVTCRSSGFRLTWIWIAVLLCDVGTHVPDYTVSEFGKQQRKSSLCVCLYNNLPVIWLDIDIVTSLCLRISLSSDMTLRHWATCLWHFGGTTFILNMKKWSPSDAVSCHKGTKSSMLVWMRW